MTTHDHAAPGDPSYDGFRIGDIWAWTMVDPADNQEGIIGFRNMPLIASDRVRLDDLAAYAQMMADTLGKPATLKRFRFVEDEITLTPEEG